MAQFCQDILQAVCLGFVHIPYIGPITFQIIEQKLVQRCETHMEAQSCEASYPLEGDKTKWCVCSSLTIDYTVSVLGREEGYTVKYTPSPEGVPEGEARGNS